MKIKPGLLQDLLIDKDWRKFIELKNGVYYLDLAAYSDNRYYLPVDGDYVRGFLFTKQAYEDKYRSKDNKIELEPSLDGWDLGGKQ